MEYRLLSPTVSVAAQVTPGDVTTIAAAGFRAVICNRPDGEGPDQPSFDEIEREAHGAGLQAAYLPVDTGKVTDAEATAFAALLERLPSPSSPTAAAARARPRCGRSPRLRGDGRCRTSWPRPGRRAST